MRIQKPSFTRIMKWTSVPLIFIFGGCAWLALITALTVDPLEPSTAYAVMFGWLAYVAWNNARTLFGLHK